MINHRASFGTTKYCNSFIRGVPCTNKECLYLHVRAPPDDCFSRQNMTIGDKEFYLRTHPGKGSVWDPVQRIFVYKHRSYSRFAGSNCHLPPAHPSSKEEGYCLHLHPRGRPFPRSTTNVIYHFGIPKDHTSYFDRPMQSPDFSDGTLIVFSSTIPTLKWRPCTSREPVGQNVDLDELFGSVG